MEQKTARLTLLIDPAKKDALERLCQQQDKTPSQVVRQLIRDYLNAHGARWTPSGLAAASASAPAAAPASAPGSPEAPPPDNDSNDDD